MTSGGQLWYVVLSLRPALCKISAVRREDRTLDCAIQAARVLALAYSQQHRKDAESTTETRHGSGSAVV